MKLYHHIPEHRDIFRDPVVTIGNFDGVHLGHRRIFSALIETARVRNADPVVITFSSHPRKVLNPEAHIKILTTTDEKVNSIYSAGISNIILLNFTEKMARMEARDFYNEILIDKIDARALVLGYDHAFGHNRQGTYDYIKELAHRSGIDISRIDEELIEGKPVSSTWIRHEIEQGNMSVARQLLGRDYSLDSKVVRGDERGRTLGYPTANLVPINSDKIIPADGVYAVTLSVDDGPLLKGMLNIGNNPTFSVTERRIEVHIFEFNDTIYDSDITIFFHDRIRNERTFISREELIGQLDRDKAAALELLNKK